jgi:hypothetical protein
MNGCNLKGTDKNDQTATPTHAAAQPAKSVENCRTQTVLQDHRRPHRKGVHQRYSNQATPTLYDKPQQHSTTNTHTTTINNTTNNSNNIDQVRSVHSDTLYKQQ